MSKAVKIIDTKKARKELKKSPDIVQKYVELLENAYEMNKKRLQQAVLELKQCNSATQTDRKG